MSEYTPEVAAKAAVEELYAAYGWDVESVGPSMQEIIDLFQPYIDHAYAMGAKNYARNIGGNNA